MSECLNGFEKLRIFCSRQNAGSLTNSFYRIKFQPAVAFAAPGGFASACPQDSAALSAAGLVDFAFEFDAVARHFFFGQAQIVGCDGCAGGRWHG